jgi:hypothetical protein
VNRFAQKVRSFSASPELLASSFARLRRKKPSFRIQPG